MDIRILIVDDNPINLLYLYKTLDKLGYPADTASDGEKAIELCIQSSQKKQFYELILMDIRMQKLDGIETTKKIKRIPYFEKSVFVAISAEYPENLPPKLFHEIIIKPINKTKLTELVTKNVFTPYPVQKEKKNHNGLHQLAQLISARLSADIAELDSLIHENKIVAVEEKLHYILGGVKMADLKELTEIINRFHATIRKTRNLQHPKLLQELKYIAQKTIKENS